MKFFIPHAESAEHADKVYAAIKAVAAATGWSIENKQIRRLEWAREDKSYTAAVGDKETRVGEEVVAILKAAAYLIYTPNMGIISGMPLVVMKDEVTAIEYFEEK